MSVKSVRQRRKLRGKQSLIQLLIRVYHTEAVVGEAIVSAQVERNMLLVINQVQDVVKWPVKTDKPLVAIIGMVSGQVRVRFVQLRRLFQK